MHSISNRHNKFTGRYFLHLSQQIRICSIFNLKDFDPYNFVDIFRFSDSILKQTSYKNATIYQMERFSRRSNDCHFSDGTHLTFALKQKLALERV